ncbi:type II toxin-antitoxin system RelE/ParE family toxin [candidate division KSB1 bacterium]|nr:type II toxin-antitoxin system RelE/ParE family toxin [candidate division KSB1 bacterium]
MKVKFKNSFIKDLKKLPIEIKQQIERLVYREIPNFDRLAEIKGIKKIEGYENYYRIKKGNYRIGFEKREDVLVFHRALHRKDIYRYFPS